MDLSAELLSQFTKVTNDKTKTTKKESFVYGTTVVKDGRTWVKIDGSEQLTPFYTTANTQPEERVTVMIKNHTAIVTGSTSHRSARLADLDDTTDAITALEILVAGKVDTDVFVAEQGRVDDLVAENASITKQLSANSALIGQLQAEDVIIEDQLTAANAAIDQLKTNKLDTSVAEITYATITDLEATNADIYNLEATYGDFVDLTTKEFTAIHAIIDNLDAGNLSVEYLKSTFATIVDLDVERGRINNLEADIGSVNTLIFGSATGDVIQTSFANAVIAQLGNAQIKSAMIDNISASKITAGDIITNNVRVMSEDGRLLISDETIQISDSTRVRVQIGKDVAGDYSINVWDNDGNLMFSAGGITDSAIKDSIIRNDMVSDTANIAAHKLDIDSLFEEINDGTHTIKSSKIYFDDEAQTLDVVFTEMSSQLDEIQNGVTTHGTQLSVIQGQITSKVWMQDIDNAGESLETKYTLLEQDLEGISAIVAGNTSTIDELDTIVASLEIDMNGFKVTIEDVSGLSTRVSTLEQTTDSLTSRISSTEQNAEGTVTRVSEAETLIQQLTESISMMVTDGNGQSLMTQTETGWTFSTGELQSVVNATSEGLNALVDEMNDVNSAVDILQQAVTDLGVIGEYVRIGVYEGEPCIELGESDSDFKLLITNTRIMFMEGTGVPAYINNQSLYIKKAVVEEELQQGDFIWKTRSNGNMGLIWKGATI